MGLGRRRWSLTVVLVRHSPFPLTSLSLSRRTSLLKIQSEPSSRSCKILSCNTRTPYPLVLKPCSVERENVSCFDPCIPGSPERSLTWFVNWRLSGNFGPFFFGGTLGTFRPLLMSPMALPLPLSYSLYHSLRINYQRTPTSGRN